LYHAGKYCDRYNQTTYTGNCYAGYYCPVNSTRPNQIECSAGHYCEEGVTVESDCPVGECGFAFRLIEVGL